jgi:hypothetical protein
VSGLYHDKMPSAEYQDLLGESNPKFVVKLFHKRLIDILKVQDGDLLKGLHERNFKTWSGPEDTGFIMSESMQYASEFEGADDASGSREGWWILLLDWWI